MNDRLPPFTKLLTDPLMVRLPGWLQGCGNEWLALRTQELTSWKRNYLKGTGATDNKPTDRPLWFQASLLPRPALSDALPLSLAPTLAWVSQHTLAEIKCAPIKRNKGLESPSMHAWVWGASSFSRLSYVIAVHVYSSLTTSRVTSTRERKREKELSTVWLFLSNVSLSDSVNITLAIMRPEKLPLSFFLFIWAVWANADLSVSLTVLYLYYGKLIWKITQVNLRSSLQTT